jgi:hypothetical protein
VIITAFLLLAGERSALAGVPQTPTRFDDPVPDVCLPADCSLREAIISANVSPGPDSFTLPTGTYTLSIQGQGENAAATGDLDITGDLMITGAGPASTIIDGGTSQDTIFQILPGATVSISGVTIRNGNPGGAYAGGLDNGGSLSLSDCAVIDNDGSGGGGGAWNDGAMTLNMCTISGNSADGHGGGCTTVRHAYVTNSTSAITLPRRLRRRHCNNQGRSLSTEAPSPETRPERTVAIDNDESSPSPTAQSPITTPVRLAVGISATHAGPRAECVTGNTAGIRAAAYRIPAMPSLRTSR